MACLQISRSGLTPCLGLGSDFRRKTNFFCLEFDLSRSPKRRSFKLSAERSLRICCRLEKGEGESNGEEPPESLFMKELKRRGMTPSSLREDSNRGLYDVSESEINSGEDNRGTSKRNGVVSAEFEKSLSNQRERSLALNSEGLEVSIGRKWKDIIDVTDKISYTFHDDSKREKSTRSRYTV